MSKPLNPNNHGLQAPLFGWPFQISKLLISANYKRCGDKATEALRHSFLVIETLASSFNRIYNIYASFICLEHKNFKRK